MISYTFAVKNKNHWLKSRITSGGTLLSTTYLSTDFRYFPYLTFHFFRFEAAVKIVVSSANFL